VEYGSENMKQVIHRPAGISRREIFDVPHNFTWNASTYDESIGRGKYNMNLNPS